MSQAQMNPDERKLSFNRVAEAYDRYRPSYPATLIEQIERTARLHTGSLLLEIGCGPGKATRLFAERSYEILCIEPGPNLISLAAERLRGYPVSFVNCLFEEWQETAQAFDLVYSAEAFHWVRKDVGYAKVAAALKPGSYLALFWNRSPRREDALQQQIEGVYQRCAPELTEGSDQTPKEMSIYEMEQTAEIRASGLFRDISVSHFPWRKRYSNEAYLGLLSTHSDHILLPPERLECVLKGVGEVIEHFGGSIELHYSAVLYMARKQG